MHIRRGFLGWGVFLILAGAVPLLVRSGTISEDQVGRLWSLWPLILIGIGIGLILSRTRFDFVGGLVVAATLGLMAGGLLSSGVDRLSTSACGSDSASVAFPAQDGTLTGETGSVDLALNCGDLTMTAAAGSEWHIEGSDRNGIGPEVEADADSLRIKSQDDDEPWWVLGTRESWRIEVPADERLEVDLELNAGSSTVTLPGARLDTLDLVLNAGSTRIDLTSIAAIGGVDFTLNAGSLNLSLPAVSMTGTIQANAGAVKLCAQPGVALRLETGESIVASYDYAEEGLVQDGSVWSTPGFESAEVKIDLRTRANAGSFTLNPEGGCG